VSVHQISALALFDDVLIRADYFLLRNGEFGSSLIQEIERLKMTRLTSRSGQPTTIREQDLQLALLRASLGTSAQQDNALVNLRWNLPLGSHRPLPSSSVPPSAKDASTSIAAGDVIRFDDVLLGTPATLSYAVGWPLELFLTPVDLNAYGVLFAFLTALRRTHTRVNSCWASLSGAQRARRRWTGVGEGGTIEDAAARKRLARCGWGVVREMAWFLDTLLGYLMTDVVDAEFRRLKALLTAPSPTANSAPGAIGGQLDFNTLRTLHATYLERLLTGSLLANSALTSIIRPVLDICDRFVGQVERWGGDVLPALLFEGNLGSDAGVGSMVKDRLMAVSEINEVCG
jgi:gamma-tubulin complex component 4